MQRYSSITDSVQRGALEKMADNVEHIDFPTFKKDFEQAVSLFNKEIGNEPYVVVFRREGKSHTWAYDIAQETLTNKPVDFVFLKRDDDLYKYFDRGIKKFVIFDDATYTGTQLATPEFGSKIHQQFRGWVEEGNNGYKFSNGIEYIAVTSAYTDAAVEEFNKLNRAYSLAYPSRAIGSDLISTRKMKNLNDILTEDEILGLYEFGVDQDGKQTLTFFDHKVSDSVSIPDPLYESLRFKDGEAFGPGVEPYKKPGTDYYTYWATQYMVRFILIFKSFFIEASCIS
jgi:hypothetical protein